jgi:hypothetical protein
VIPTCDRCAGWIVGSNLRWPGYCSAHCRDAARREAERIAAEEAQRRRVFAAAKRGDPTARTQVAAWGYV